MEKEILNIITYQWRRFLKFGGGFDTEKNKWQEPSKKDLETFMNWLRDEINYL